MKATVQVCFHLLLVEGTELAHRARKHHPVRENEEWFKNSAEVTQHNGLPNSPWPPWQRGKRQLTFPGNPSSSSFLGACPGFGLETVCLAELSSPLVWVKLITRAGIRYIESFQDNVQIVSVKELWGSYLSLHLHQVSFPEKRSLLLISFKKMHFRSRLWGIDDNWNLLAQIVCNHHFSKYL